MPAIRIDIISPLTTEIETVDHLGEPVPAELTLIQLRQGHVRICLLNRDRFQGFPCATRDHPDERPSQIRVRNPS